MLFRYIATFLSHTVLVVCICVYYHFVFAENDEQTMEQIEQMETPASPSTPPSKDSLEQLHHKIPLIDILFSDGSKRTCTGAIINEYVVITAGHCFMTLPGGREAEAEITGSFVIIGSKKKFENGYEQYLPIEKVIIHPRYKEWSCDLALIYTFSSMEKIGDMIPLASEKVAINQEPNVTILSWSPYLEMSDNEEPICCIDNSCTPDDAIEKCHSTTHRQAISEEKEEREAEAITEDHKEEEEETLHDHHKKHKVQPERTGELYTRGSNDWSYLRKSAYRKTTEQGRFETIRSVDKVTEEGFSPKKDMLVTVMDRAYFGKFRRFVYRQQLRKHQNAAGIVRTTEMDSSWWRRGLGEHSRHELQHAYNSEYKFPVLSLESFGFINLATCKKMIAKSRPHVVMEENEMICFTSDDHFVSDSDAGAPVVREGQLIAITVGGTGTSADHIVVAMKLNYFCMWINQNLPPGSHLLHCWDETHVMNAMRIVNARPAHT